MKTPLYVFDLDMTLADCSNRLPLIQQDSKNWDGFWAAVGDDKPIEWTIKLLRNYLSQTTCSVMILSGRSDASRGLTLDWIHKNIGYPVILEMRKHGDHRPDTVVKPEILAKILELNPDHEVAFIVEDRQRMVDTWRGLGYNVLQCAKGDY